MNFDFIFKKYNWRILVYIFFSDDEDIEEVLCNLKLLDCPSRIIRRAKDRMLNYQDSGFTYTNPDYNKSIIVINLPNSINELVDTYNHEKNHVEMHICKKFNIDPYSELAAYLSGYLAKSLFKVILNNIVKN